MNQLTETPRTPAKVEKFSYKTWQGYESGVSITFTRCDESHSLKLRWWGCGQCWNIYNYEITNENGRSACKIPDIKRHRNCDDAIQEILDHFHLIKA